MPPRFLAFPRAREPASGRPRSASALRGRFLSAHGPRGESVGPRGARWSQRHALVCHGSDGPKRDHRRPTVPPDPHHDRRWMILAVIAIAQLLVILDVSIVNIALPSAQRDLGFSDDQRQWLITDYALAFGSLLLLGGRIGDLFGRKWTFVAGLLGFAGASAVGGAAPSFGVLVSARAVQGAFAALLAPAALSLLATTFIDPAERGKAFGVFGAIAASGGAIGLLLGGALTEPRDWRWGLCASLVVALPAALAALRLLPHVPSRDRPRLDIAGTLAASAGLFALVFG